MRARSRPWKGAHKLDDWKGAAGCGESGDRKVGVCGDGGQRQGQYGTYMADTNDVDQE